MSKVFSLPEGFEAPKFDFKQNVEVYNKSCDDFSNKLKQWLIERNPDQEHVGEIIDFPVADGKALYMVAAIKPVQIIHLPYWDGYESPMADTLNAKRIGIKITQQKALADLFSKKK
jgi:hypothetical protein